MLKAQQLPCVDGHARCQCGLRVPCTNVVYHVCKRPGLGDMVASGLAAIGITKQRAAAVMGGDCGCSKRQEQLNAIGRRLGIG